MEGSGCWPQRRSPKHSGPSKKDRKRLFIENGSKLLEELITCCKDKCRCNPIRSFSAKQILEATNYCQSNCYPYSYFEWYKGILDNRPVLIKKYYRNSVDRACRDIAISSQMSSHKNVLKLLGYCLESSRPVLVYEDAENGLLRSNGGLYLNSSSLSWAMRLKVAKEIANAITYLHNAFARPIIHRNIFPSNIFIDKDYVSKLCNFDVSISIPEGKTQVADDTVFGRIGFVDPCYYDTFCVTEQTDVYSFGVLLLVLITGKEANKSICSDVINSVEKEQFNEIVDPKILEEGGSNEDKELQLQAFIKLALNCTKEDREERPLMIDVAKELVKIERSTS